MREEMLRTVAISAAIILFLTGVCSLEDIKSSIGEFLPPQPLSLEQIIDYALRDNFDIEIANRRIDEYKAKLDQINATFFPTVSLGYSKYYIHDYPYLAYDETGEYAIEVTQTLFKGGERVAKRSAAKNNYFSQRNLLDYTQKKIIYSIKASFYACLLYKEKMDVLLRQRDILEEHLRVVNARYRTGEASRLDLLRAKTSLQELMPLISETEKYLQTSYDNLKILMGRDVEERIEIRGQLQESNFPVIRVSELIDEGLANRPDLASLSFRIKAQQDIYRAEFSGFLPEVNLSFTDNFPKHFTFTLGRDEYEDYWTVLLTFKIDVFDGMLTASRINQEKQVLKQLKAEHKKLIQNIKSDIRETVLNLQQVNKDILSNKENLRLSVEVLDAAKERFFAGEASQLDFLDAQIKYREANLKYLESLYTQQELFARLEFVTGLDLEDIFPETKGDKDEDIS